MDKGEKIGIDRLREDPLNLRHHGNENIEMLKRSLQESGQYRPLIVDRATMTVMIGNGRLRAMRELGWRECWCILVDFSQHGGMEVLDNRLNELSSWKDRESLDDWLANDKGIDWWGVDSAKSVELFEKSRKPEPAPNKEKPSSTGSARKEHLCPCCGKPLKKVVPVKM